jgi:pimeloyl-ACP methyl ester carboxylesterase
MKFHEFGDKENQHIMLIHGGGNSWWNYLRQAKALSKEYHVILPTLDGHGEEYNTEYVSTIDSAQKLISYINQNCNGQLFLLCGVSLGGQIVIEMLSLKADISQKAIIDGSICYPQPKLEKFCIATVRLFGD